MKNAALIYFEDNITENELAFCSSKTYLFIEKTLEQSSFNGDVFYSIPAEFCFSADGRKVIKREAGSSSGWLEIFSNGEYENIIKIPADAPFIDPHVITEMLEVHTKYLAEFTYSENLPTGLSCEIFSYDLIKSLPADKDKMLPVTDVIKKNINNFDVELFYKDPDIRDKRISFLSGNKRDKIIMERIYACNGGIPEYKEIKIIIEEHPELLFIAPAYYEIELSFKKEFPGICSVNSVLKNKRDEMNLSVLGKIIEEADSFGLEYAVSFAGAGDPFTHSDIAGACDIVLKSSYVSMLILETDAVFKDRLIFDYMKKKNDDRIKIIAEINGYNKETYSSIHLSENFELAAGNVLEFKKILGNKNVFLQIQKINETEAFLDKYYDYWEKEEMSIILMKQNTYLGLVQDRKYYDLSPVDRMPCWHLQRDLFILADSSVPFCREDIDGQNSESLKMKSLRQIWESRLGFFTDNYRGKYPKCPDCSVCDEWYSFNN